MLGVEFEKNKNVTFLIYNEGTFFSKKDFQLHSSFNMALNLFECFGYDAEHEDLIVIIQFRGCLTSTLSLLF